MRLRLSSSLVGAAVVLAFLLAPFHLFSAAPLPRVADLEWQPLAAQVNRLI